MKKVLILALILIIISSGLVYAKEKDLDSKKIKTIPIKERLIELNNFISENNLGWTAGETSISLEEISLSKIKFKSDKKVPLLKTVSKGVYPSSLDWRNNSGNWLTPIKTQGLCGSCWAFSAIGVVESRVNIALNSPDYNINLSEQDLVSCSSAGNCSGGNEGPALGYIRTNGVVRESCFPYTGTDESCGNKCGDNELIKILNYNLIPSTIFDIKQAINDYGPVTVYMEVYDDFGFYTGGIYETPYFANNSHWMGYHAVSIVGYNDTDEYWIGKNSWGTGWGESGYFRISYNAQTFNFDPIVFTDGYFFLDESYVVSSTDIDNDGIPDESDSFPFGVNIRINEIMYNPNGTDTNREWIEIYNPFSISVNLTDWIFYEADINHGLTLIQGDWILEDDEYAIIANNDVSFLLDYPSFSGTLFDSSFSLLDTGENLSIKNSNGEIVDSVFYSNLAAEGFSLELFDDGWSQSFSIGGTPGIRNNNGPPVITNFQVNPIVSISKNNPMNISADVSDKDLKEVAIVLVDSNNLISDNQTLFIVSVDDSGVSGSYALDDWPALYFNIANDIVSEPVTIFVPETPPNELFVFGSFQKNPPEGPVQSDCMLAFNMDNYTLLGGGCEGIGDINPQIENGISEFTVSSMKFINGSEQEPISVNGNIFTLYDIITSNELNPRLEEALVPSGDYSVIIHIEDKARNFADDEENITVDNDPPEVFIISPLDGEVFLNETINGTTISFNGTATDVVDGDLTASLEWGTINASIGSGGSFSATLPVGKHDINARVTDNAGWSTKDKHVIYVNTPGNTAPIANAGEDISVYVNNLVTLDGSASSDPENDTLTYSWIQKEGPFTFSIESEIVNPTFTPSKTGTYVFKLMVNDGILDGFDVVTITVSNPPSPPSGGGSSGGGGSAITCKENWLCSEWTKCSVTGSQLRRCTDINNCGTTNDKPEERQDCVYEPSCNDGMKNGDEEGIDCGGSCEKECKEEEPKSSGMESITGGFIGITKETFKGIGSGFISIFKDIINFFGWLF